MMAGAKKSPFSHPLTFKLPSSLLSSMDPSAICCSLGQNSTSAPSSFACLMNPLIPLHHHRTGKGAVKDIEKLTRVAYTNVLANSLLEHFNELSIDSALYIKSASTATDFCRLCAVEAAAPYKVLLIQALKVTVLKDYRWVISS